MSKLSVLKSALASQRKSAPSAGMSNSAKSAAVSEAREGKDMGDKGKNFEKVETSASKKYGSAAAGKRVAGAVFWQKMKSKG